MRWTSWGRGGRSELRQAVRPVPLTSWLLLQIPLLPFPGKSHGHVDSDSAALDLGKHRSPEVTEGQKLPPPSLLACFKVLQSSPKSSPIPSCPQRLQWWQMPVLCSPSIGENSRRRCGWVRQTNPLLPLDPQKCYHLFWSICVFDKNSK